MRRTDSLEKTLKLGKTEGKRRRGWQGKGWLDSITNLIDMNVHKLQDIVEDRGAWHAGVAKIQTRRSNETTVITLGKNLGRG